MSWNIEFYKTEGGREPVKEFLGLLPIKHQIKMAKTINLLRELGPILKEPHSRHVIGTELKELRIQFSPNIYRIFYFAYVNKGFILLHAFTKKTEQTPRREIEVALNRVSDYIRRYKDD